MDKKKEFIKVLKFVAFSASAGVIQIVADLLLNLLPDSLFGAGGDNWFTYLVFGKVENSKYCFCYLVSILLSVLWNFTFNRKFTFKSATNVPIAMLKVLGFYVVFIPLSTRLVGALVSAGWQNIYAVLLNMIINFVTEFLFDEFVVFRDKKEESAVGVNACELSEPDCKDDKNNS